MSNLKEVQQKKLIQDLEKLLKMLNVKQLYDDPSHKDAKNWIAEVSAVLKESRRHSYKDFNNLSQHIYGSVPLSTRKHAAEQIDVLMRKVIAQYKKEYATNEPTKDGNVGDRSEKVSWYKNPVIMVPAVVVILAAIIGASWWPDLLKMLKSSNFADHTVESPVPTITTPKMGILRPLKPLETGKKIGELPNEVYFFGNPSSIEYEIKDPKQDWLDANGKDTRYNFELQKIDSRYYLIGFISDEAQSKIGTLIKDSIYTQLFPNKWGGTKNLVAIPFDAIYTIKYREINLDEVKTVTIFDIGFKDVSENPEFHKSIEL